MNPTVYTVKVYADRTEWRNERGKRHRLDGPAVEWANGNKFWFVEGKLHRLDGPAVEWADGSKEWYVKGKYHRLDGPACEWDDGRKEWWIEGKYLTEEEFNNYTQPIRKQNKISIPDLLKTLFEIYKHEDQFVEHLIDLLRHNFRSKYLELLEHLDLGELEEVNEEAIDKLLGLPEKRRNKAYQQILAVILGEKR